MKNSRTENRNGGQKNPGNTTRQRQDSSHRSGRFPREGRQHFDLRDERFDAFRHEDAPVRDEAYESPSYGRDDQLDGYGPRQLAYESGEYRQPFSQRTSMRSEGFSRQDPERYGSSQYANARYDQRERWDSLWGPSHYPHPTSSGETWTNGSYGGDSNFGVGQGSGSPVGSDLGYEYGGANRPPLDRQFRGERSDGPAPYGSEPLPRYARGPRGYKRSDARIQEDLSERLHYLHDLDSSDVEVTVKDSVVTLTGTVPERTMRFRLENIAARCLGVQDVVNEVKVKR